MYKGKIRERHLLLLLFICLSVNLRGQQTALKTNVLFWGTTTPNAGVEVGIARQFTVEVWGAYNAWKFSNDMKLNLYLIQPEARYWFCRKFEGHFVGVLRTFQYRANPFYIRSERVCIAGRPLRRRPHLRVSLGDRRPLGPGSDDRRRIRLYEIRQVPVCRLRRESRLLHKELYRTDTNRIFYHLFSEISLLKPIIYETHPVIT